MRPIKTPDAQMASPISPDIFYVSAMGNLHSVILTPDVCPNAHRRLLMNSAQAAPHYTLDVSERWLARGKIVTLDFREIHDPFITTKVRPRGWLAAWAVLCGRWECIVRVRGDQGAHRAVFESDYTPRPVRRPITGRMKVDQR